MASSVRIYLANEFNEFLDRPGEGWYNIVLGPHRLEAQDAALSRLKREFESRWGHTPQKSRAFPAFLL